MLRLRKSRPRVILDGPFCWEISIARNRHKNEKRERWKMKIFNVPSLLSEDIRNDRAPQVVAIVTLAWKMHERKYTSRNTRRRCMHALARSFSRARDATLSFSLSFSLFHSSLRCLGRSRFRSVYLYRVYRKIVCHRVADYSSRKIDPRAKQGRVGRDRSKIAGERWQSRVRAYRREKWTKKGSFPRGFIDWRRSSPPYCKGKHMFRPVVLLARYTYAETLAISTPPASV